MIIVASSGYAFKDNEYPVFFPGDFDSELVNSIIPYIEENFKVKKGRNNRAVAGLSLGSGQATDIAARHPELFSAVGVFSGVAIHLMKKIIDSHIGLKLSLCRQEMKKKRYCLESMRW